MGQFNLAFLVCQQKSFCSLEHAKSSALETRGVLAGMNSVAPGFDPGHSNVRIVQEWMEQSDSVTSAADTGYQQIGQTFLALENLLARFDADDALKVTDHHGVGMRTED